MTLPTSEEDLVRAKVEAAMTARKAMLNGSVYSGWYQCACGVEADCLRVVAAPLNSGPADVEYKFSYSCTNCSFRLQE